MGCIISTVRAAAALFLGVVVFVGFLFLLVVGNFTDKLLNADFYNDTIAGQDSYNRIYDEVLVDPEIRDRTDELLGNIPEEQRLTFILHHYSGLPLPEVADVMQSNVATTKSRLRLAREKLQEKLQARGVTVEG